MKINIYYIVIIILSFAQCSTTINQQQIRNESHLISNNQLIKKINKINSKYNLTGFKFAISFYDLTNNQIIIDINSDQYFHPASLNKILTSVWGLKILGVNYKFPTIFAFNKKKKILYIKGYGDGSLSYEKFAYELRNFLWTNDIKQLDKLVIDNSYFDNLKFGKGWMWDDGPYFFNSPINALNINHNGLSIWLSKITPKIKKARFYPLLKKTFKVLNKKMFRSGIRVHRNWQNHNDSLLISLSKINSFNKNIQLFRTIDDPNVFVENIIKDILKTEHISYTDSNFVSYDTLQTTGTIKKIIYSDPLSLYIYTMNKRSDNLFAETIHKAIGALLLAQMTEQQKTKYLKDPFSGYDLTQISIDSMNTFLKSEVNFVNKFKIVDGAGNSRYNLLANKQILLILIYIFNQFPYKYELISSFPIAKTDGTLIKRFGNINSRYIIRAKTGTLSNNSGIAGYIEDRLTKKKFAFVLQEKDFLIPTYKIKKWEDEVISLIINLLQDK